MSVKANISYNYIPVKTRPVLKLSLEISLSHSSQPEKIKKAIYINLYSESPKLSSKSFFTGHRLSRLR